MNVVSSQYYGAMSHFPTLLGHHTFITFAHELRVRSTSVLHMFCKNHVNRNKLTDQRQTRRPPMPCYNLHTTSSRHLKKICRRVSTFYFLCFCNSQRLPQGVCELLPKFTTYHTKMPIYLYFITSSPRSAM